MKKYIVTISKSFIITEDNSINALQKAREKMYDFFRKLSWSEGKELFDLDFEVREKK